MNTTHLIKVSKFLSYHLRHDPEALGLKLETGGWVSVDALIAACAKTGKYLSKDQLTEIVANDNKQRYSFNEDHTKIRANQGHSVEVDLQLKIVEPPEVLYHGTASKSVKAIFESGLLPMNRHHVHMSEDAETARKVGGRHGRPVVLVVMAQLMRSEGATFYRSENGVWLTDKVLPKYLRRP